MNLNETHFLALFQYLNLKLTQSNPNEKSLEILQQATNFLEDCHLTVQRLLTKNAFSDIEEIILNALKISEKLETKFLLDHKCRFLIMSLYQDLGILYKRLKNENKGYKFLKTFLATINLNKTSSKKDFFFNGIEKIFITFSEFCISIGKYNEGIETLKKTTSLLETFFSNSALTEEFKQLTTDSFGNDRSNDKILKKRLILVHSYSLISKCYRKSNKLDQACGFLEMSTRLVKDCLGEKNDIFKKFEKKLEELKRTRDFFHKLENSLSDIEEKDDKNRFKISENQRKINLESTKTEGSKRKLTIPMIKIMCSEGNFSSLSDKSNKKEIQEPKTPHPNEENKTYFIEKGFNVKAVHQREKNYPLAKNFLVRTTATASTARLLSSTIDNNNNNTLKIPNSNSMRRNTHRNLTDSKNINEKFFNKLSEIGSTKRKTLNPTTSTWELNGSFETKERETENITHMKQNYFLTSRPSTALFKEKEKLITRSSVKNNDRTKISNKNRNSVNRSKQNLMINLPYSNFDKSPSSTPRHKIGALSPLDSFSKKINSHSRKLKDIDAIPVNSQPRESSKRKKSDPLTKANSYIIKKPFAITSLLRNPKKRNTHYVEIKSSIIKSPSLEELKKYKEVEAPRKISDQSCFSENLSPLRKSQYELKDLDSVNESDKKEQEDYLNMIKLDKIKVKIQRRTAGLKILKLLKSWLLLKKYSIIPEIYGSQIPKSYLKSGSPDDKELIKNLTKKYGIKNIEIPKTPTPYIKEELCLWGESGSAFNILSGVLRKKDNIFPTKALEISFFCRKGGFKLKDCNAKQIFSVKEDNIELETIISEGNRDFRLLMNANTLEIRNDNLYYQYIWPLMHEMLVIHLKEIKLTIPKLKYNSIFEEALVLYEADVRMNSLEEFHFKELLKKLRFLIDNHTICFRKPNGSVLKLTNQEFMLKAIKQRDSLKDFLKLRSSFIRKSVCSVEVINPILLSYLGFETFIKTTYSLHKKRNLLLKKALTSYNLKYPPPIFQKNSIEYIYKGLSSMSSNLSPQSKEIQRNHISNFLNPNNGNFEIVPLSCDTENSEIQEYFDIDNKKSELNSLKEELNVEPSKKLDKFTTLRKKQIATQTQISSLPPSLTKRFSIPNKKPLFEIIGTSVIKQSSVELEMRLEHFVDIKSHFPAYIFCEKPINLSEKAKIYEANYNPFYKGELLYSQIIKIKGMYFNELIKIDFPVRNERIPDDFIFIIQIQSLQKKKSGNFTEEKSFSFKKFKKLFFGESSFNFTEFIYKKSFTKTQKLLIKMESEKIFSLEDANFKIEPAIIFEPILLLEKNENNTFFQEKEENIRNSQDHDWVVNCSEKKDEELPLMKYHKSLLFLRGNRYYLRLHENLYYRFVFDNEYSNLNLSFYAPLQKKLHYSIMKSQVFIEKVLLLLQKSSKALQEKIVRSLFKPEWSLLGSKIKIRDSQLKSNEYFLIMKLAKVGRVYVTIGIYQEKMNNKVNKIKIEIRPANSKLKVYLIRMNNEDIESFSKESQHQDEEILPLLKEVLKKVVITRGFLYKYPIFTIKGNSFLQNSNVAFASGKRILKEKVRNMRVIFQKNKKINNSFAIVSVIKYENLDFWNIRVSFMGNSRTFITNFYNSDLLKMEEKTLLLLFPQDLQELQEDFEKKNIKNYQQFHELFSIENKLNSKTNFRRTISKECIEFAEFKFWERVIDILNIYKNLQGKLLLKINNFEGILRETIGIGTIDNLESKKTLYYECFFDNPDNSNFNKKILDLNSVKPYAIYLRLTDLALKDCKNYKFSLEHLTKEIFPAVLNQSDLKKVLKWLKKQIKHSFYHEIPLKFSAMRKEEIYKLNGDIKDYNLNAIRNHTFLLYKGVFGLRPRRIIGIFLNAKRKEILFFLYENFEAKKLINIVKLYDLKKVIPFISEMMKEGLKQELGSRIFKYFKNRLFFHNFYSVPFKYKNFFKKND